MNRTTIAKKGSREIVNVLGHTIEFLSSADEGENQCVMIGTIPAGVDVPLHSHADVENFYVLSGSVQVWREDGPGSEWVEAKQGDFVHVPANVRHAFRNTTVEPVIQVITSTPKIGRFFRELGRPVAAGEPLSIPTDEDIQRFLKVSASYGYWNASPEENAAIGIRLPG